MISCEVATTSVSSYYRQRALHAALIQPQRREIAGLTGGSLRTSMPDFQGEPA
jgi:hypothetical protein